MKTTTPKELASYNITGNFPIRPADAEDQTGYPCKTVAIPCGFECLYVNVFGFGINATDAIDAAFEYIAKNNPNWTADWEGHMENAYIA